MLGHTAAQTGLVTETLTTVQEDAHAIVTHGTLSHALIPTADYRYIVSKTQLDPTQCP